MAFLCPTLRAQYVYTIKADSVKITNCDSAELILENHTQNVPGFLFNTGNGRTIFKRATQKLNDSMYVIGADTITLPPSWKQGGNAFGAPGVLGTNDNQPLNFYIAGQQRASLSNNGNLIVGSGTDNGNLLQVNGNANIGTATITQTGLLYGTNAILFDYFTPRYHNYRQTAPFISRLEDILYNYNGRLNTTTTQAPDGTVNIDIIFPPDELYNNQGITYPSGRMFFSFWDNGIPQTVSVTPVNYQGGTAGPYTSSTNLNTGGAGLFEVDVYMGNWMTELRVTITPQPGGFVNLQDMAYVLDGDNEGLTNPNPYVSKYQDEHIFNYFYLKNGGVDNVRLSPLLYSPNYFLNPIGVGTTTPTAQFHTTGSVRFAGLTQDNSQTNILVSDSQGNLYTRSAASLAADNLIRSSLTIDGTIKSKKLIISPDVWADYVFDSTFRLTPLSEVETYIHKEHHLPDLPAAAEVQKQGLDVGTNQAALLKKIEELTLYTIDQKRELTDQKTEIMDQKAEIKDLKIEIEASRNEILELKKMIRAKLSK